MRSIRSQITFLVLLGTMTEAVLLGGVGYSSVAAVSRNAEDLQRISLALDGTRELSGAVGQLTHPNYALDGGIAWDEELFLDDLGAMEARLDTCAASECHGLAKQPPAMAERMKGWMREIRAGGLALFAEPQDDAPFPLDQWLGVIEQPAHSMAAASDAMANELTARIRALERSTEQARRAGTLFVALATFLSMVVVVAVSHPVSRGITRPLEALAARLRSLEPEDEPKCVSEDGPDEVARLARSFNAMTGRLAESRAALRAHQAQLEQRVRQGVADVRARDDELRRSDRLSTVGLVASSMAHDLHNPLAAVRVNAELLAEELDENDPNRELVQDLVTDVHRCCTVADEIRSMAAEGDVRMQPCTAAEIASTAAEAVRMLGFKWKPLGITVAIDDGGAGGGNGAARTCLCSLPRIHQVLVNLVDNALAVTPPCGRVDVRVRDDAGAIRVEIEDQGPGIPRARRADLLQPFTTTKAGGLGLGLALCRRIVEQHRARIEFDTWTREELGSVSGRDSPGTVVRIVLPLVGHVEERSSHGERTRTGHR
jgi:signal transduction histidine kinase